MRAGERQGGKTKREPAKPSPPTSAPGRFRASCRGLGPKGDGSERRKERGGSGERIRRGASAVSPGSAEATGPLAGARGGEEVLRGLVEAQPGFVSERRRRGGRRSRRRRPEGRKASPPPTARPQPRPRGRCRLRGPGDRVCVWWGPGPGDADVGLPEARRRREAARGLLGPLPSTSSRGLGHPNPRRERETSREVRPRYGPLTPRGHSDSLTCGLTATDCTACPPVSCRPLA